MGRGKFHPFTAKREDHKGFVWQLEAIERVLESERATEREKWSIIIAQGSYQV